MPARAQLIGQRFGRLKVRSLIGVRNGGQLWLCRCECGRESKVTTKSLRGRHVVSCGCFRLEILRTKAITHGMSKTNIYHRYCSMIDRCCNPRAEKYQFYGGRGIRICKRWRNSFSNFLKDMGLPPVGTSLDRIDVNGNYEPSNCRWATRSQQMKNRRPFLRGPGKRGVA
jgi:hypothetical protein